MTTNQITLDSANLYHTLQSAFRQATADETALRQWMGSKRTLPLDETLPERFDGLVSKQLPEAFGHFISGVDLQHSFLQLGRYVRSFADAAFVIKNMETSILSQMEKFSITASCKWVDELVSCCHEVSKMHTFLNNTDQ
ncbi:MAG: hypothetical protein P0Y49_14100 [Candidatus Pedobacter colombiensis]|uniref:Uncharacterized protein n=1 Tax=Candidatus Pedobacter colombiensis TaxID=3121371 RepID=A0AAJ5W4D2_9SPHI|nr:hypothetical protein [Pedobacter sp.]WEK17931.1 MAG: hypothetical protein P0Y49_14100 [Pedobacter sp.]